MNKFFISGSIIIICGLLIGVTSFKVIRNHNEKLILVNEKYIIERAKKCINDNECKSDKVTLKELHDLEYINRQVNPVTKEYYNDSSYVTKENNEYVFKVIPN